MCLNTGTSVPVTSVPVALTCVSLQFMDEIKLFSKIFEASAPLKSFFYATDYRHSR